MRRLPRRECDAFVRFVGVAPEIPAAAWIDRVAVGTVYLRIQHDQAVGVGETVISGIAVEARTDVAGPLPASVQGDVHGAAAGAAGVWYVDIGVVIHAGTIAAHEFALLESNHPTARGSGNRRRRTLGLQMAQQFVRQPEVTVVAVGRSSGCTMQVVRVVCNEPVTGLGVRFILDALRSYSG